MSRLVPYLTLIVIVTTAHFFLSPGYAQSPLRIEKPDKFRNNTKVVTRDFNRYDRQSFGLENIPRDSAWRFVQEKRIVELLDLIKNHSRSRGKETHREVPPFGAQLNQSLVADTIQPAWVRQYGSGVYSSIEIPLDNTLDAEGNCYVVGGGYNSSFDVDFLVVKYDRSGNQVWVRRYDTGGKRDEAAGWVRVDQNGNVYLAGITGTSEDYDYLIVKYDVDGELLWTARYDGPGSAADRLQDMELDPNGNVYVTGGSRGSGTNDDYATIKYSPAGEQMWVARYDGFNSYDAGVAVTLDDAGNVYVTGTSADSSADRHNDFATIKYDSAGIRQWVARYNGHGKSYDAAIALAVDDSDNVYVAGNCSDSSSYYNYAVVKYNPSGSEQWNAHYDGPSSDNDNVVGLALDGSSNIYLTGTSYAPNRGVTTIKYNNDGLMQWTARYEAPGSEGGEAADLAIDARGNVIVTATCWTDDNAAWDFTTIKYTSAGSEQWTARYDGPHGSWITEIARSVSIDHSGKVYVSGLSAYDFATVKYKPDGAQEWVCRYSEIGSSEDHLTALEVDRSGNAYVTGYSFDTSQTLAYLTLKYTSSGDISWAARAQYTSGQHTYDSPSEIAVDDLGDVYVTGPVTVKYDPSGSEAWVRPFEGENAEAMTLDHAGNVFVTGAAATTIKYDAAGTEQWRARYYGGDSIERVATRIFVDDSGNTYVAGEFTGGIVGICFADSCWDCGDVICCDYDTCSWNDGSGIFIVKYDPSGVELWSSRYGLGNEMSDRLIGFGSDDSGNVYVLACSYDGEPNFDMDYLAIKYTSSGEERWKARHSLRASYHFQASSGTVDRSGNTFIAGAYTIKFDSTGTEQWAAPADFTSFGAIDIKLDKLGNVCITGRGWAASSEAFKTAMYSKSGTLLWRADYNTPASLSVYDDPIAVGVDSAGNIYVAGQSSYGSVGSMYTIVKYQQPVLGVDDALSTLPQRFNLSQNYPNPFNPATIIRFELPKESFVRLIVYDVLGQEVASLVDEKLVAGKYESAFNGARLSSGVYFYKLQAGNFVDSKKFLLIK